MRKRLFLGALMAMIVVLMLSCNKERYELNHLESAQTSGHWKLPLGSVDIKLGDVLKQFLQNDWISYDTAGNLQVSSSFQLNNIIKGSTFLSLGSLYFSHTLSFTNPFPGLVLPEPIADSLKFQQVIEIKSDSATIESAVVKTGTLLLDMNNNNIMNIDSIVISSSGISMEDGDSLYSITHGLTHEINLAGATFRVHHENGVVDSTLILNYAIYFSHKANDALPEQYQLTTIIGLNNLKLKEISGYIDQFSYDFSVDTSFSLPLENVQGQLSLVGANVSIKEKNTFENLHAHLQVDCAELYGGSVAPSQFFDHYPYVLEIVPSNSFVEIMDEQTFNLTYVLAGSRTQYLTLLTYDQNIGFKYVLEDITDIVKNNLAGTVVMQQLLYHPGLIKQLNAAHPLPPKKIFSDFFDLFKQILQQLYHNTNKRNNQLLSRLFLEYFLFFCIFSNYL